MKFRLNLCVTIKVIFGIASESQFDIFNSRNERVLEAFESKSITFSFILVR